MQKSLQIAPSILGADFGHLANEVAALSEGGADLVHVDMMDGRFVPNLTFGAVIIRQIRRTTQLPVDVHMMVLEPERHLRAVAEAGADIITVHAEATTHLQRTLSEIRNLGKKAGVALNPSTSPSVLEYILADIDVVLVMTVNPGFSGQSCLPHIVPKISSVHQMIRQCGFDIRIHVDGGINPKTAASVVRAGAETLVAGAAIFEASDRRDAIRQLRDAAQMA
jgi:ribulose-phosphate 3-epimerase